MKVRTFAILCLIVGVFFCIYAATLLSSLQQTAANAHAIYKVLFFFVIGTAFVAVAQQCGLFPAFRWGSDEGGEFDADGASDADCGGDADGDCGGD